jgi:hypothetical protein
VIECVIDRSEEEGMLRFDFRGFSCERDHLEVREASEAEAAAVERAALLNQQGVSTRNLEQVIRQEFGIRWSHTTIARKIRAFLARSKAGEAPASAAEVKPAPVNGYLM